MPPRQTNNRSAANTAWLLAEKTRENAQLRVELAEMEQTAKKAAKDFYRLQDEIEQAVLSTTYFTHVHRKLNGMAMVALAEHLTMCSSDTMTRSKLAADIEIVKNNLLLLAQQDITPLIDAATENLCKQAGMTTYTVAHQVILENQDTVGKGELKEAIEKRVRLVRAQENLVWGLKDLSLRQKKRRIAGLANDVAAQLKADPSFDFQHKVVPRAISVPQGGASFVDLSLADLVSSKLALEETSNSQHEICIVT